MNGGKIGALKRRLITGDSAAQDLAWELNRCNDADAVLLLEKHADIVAQYTAPEEADDQHPTFKFDQ